MIRIKQHFKLKKQRNRKLITPCCGRTNKDGKFVNYEGLPEQYGYCHSCGVASNPPPLYGNENGEEFIYDTTLGKMVARESYHSPLPESVHLPQSAPERKAQQFILWEEIRKTMVHPDNPLSAYLKRTYDPQLVKRILALYNVGSTADGGTVFWYMKDFFKAQKSKVCHYTPEGRRTNRFSVPYKNEDGYYRGLFGQHLINEKTKAHSTFILVESEKTALVGAINIDDYIWLAYGGLNGLTDELMEPLKGCRVMVIPDMSERAVEVMQDKVLQMQKMGIKTKIWDATDGCTDEELKQQGTYNMDLEDWIRNEMLTIDEIQSIISNYFKNG